LDLDKEVTTPKATPHPAWYRVAQFFVALKAYLPTWAGGRRGPLSAHEQALVTSILKTPLQQALFSRMSPNDQRHALAVVHTLRQGGHTHPALLQAALLHDVAKCLGQPIIHRVLIVLFEAFWPAALQRLSSPANLQFAADHWSPALFYSIRGWRRPFVVHARHPAIGAIWAKEAGCHPLAVALIDQHQNPPPQETTQQRQLLVALQWADNLN